MPTPTYTAIATITLASTDSEIVFSSIPATYRDLVLVVKPIVSTTAFGQIRFNGVSTSSYSWVYAYGDSGGAGSVASSNTFIDANAMNTNFQGIYQIMDYSATDKHKTVLHRTGDLTANYVVMQASRFASTAAITSINFFVTSNTFNARTTLSLYGIEA